MNSNDEAQRADFIDEARIYADTAKGEKCFGCRGT